MSSYSLRTNLSKPIIVNSKPLTNYEHNANHTKCALATTHKPDTTTSSLSPTATSIQLKCSIYKTQCRRPGHEDDIHQ